MSKPKKNKDNNNAWFGSASSSIAVVVVHKSNSRCRSSSKRDTNKKVGRIFKILIGIECSMHRYSEDVRRIHIQACCSGASRREPAAI